jgi:hypothetical protein
MSALRYQINDKECDSEAFRAATGHLDYGSSEHCYYPSGEFFSFEDGSSVELIIHIDTNQHGFKREARVWSFTTI